MIKTVFKVSAEVKDDRTLHSILAYLMEEVGELATEINIQKGFSKKKSGTDGVIGEAVDVILCALDIIKINHPNITPKQLKEIAKDKCKKWKRNKEYINVHYR